MDVSRQTALEIFGLSENFTPEEVENKFRKLSKIVHPDAGGDVNLFKFINRCRETLLDNVKASDARQAQEEPKNKISADINLSTLYDIYYRLQSYMSIYDIIEIIGTARIFIMPCRNKKHCVTTIINFSQPFREFQELTFANFSTTVKLPEKLKKFKRFKIRVEFMGETFEFRLSMNSPFHIVKCEKTRFNSIIELNFEYE